MSVLKKAASMNLHYQKKSSKKNLQVISSPIFHNDLQ